MSDTTQEQPKTLMEMAMRHVEQVSLSLSGDEDYMPFITLRDHRGQTHIVGTMMP